MACNCGKGKKPLGPSSGSSTTNQTTRRPFYSPGKMSVNGTAQFTASTKDGRAVTFGSRLEYDAARQRGALSD